MWAEVHVSQSLALTFDVTREVLLVFLFSTEFEKLLLLLFWLPKQICICRPGLLIVPVTWTRFHKSIAPRRHRALFTPLHLISLVSFSVLLFTSLATPFIFSTTPAALTPSEVGGCSSMLPKVRLRRWVAASAPEEEERKQLPASRLPSTLERY